MPDTIHRRLTADLTIAAPQHRQAERWIGSSSTSRCRDRGRWRPIAQPPGRDGRACMPFPSCAGRRMIEAMALAGEVFHSISAALQR
ncbi:hypothetical protein U1708_10940 [Sphingomonas sp. ZB1N12]|uniref:hypothetical protein n=1 Tax=Sphingomonas arabinosi TaxID=3096160 RepID=UPI002FC9FCAC